MGSRPDPPKSIGRVGIGVGWLTGDKKFPTGDAPEGLLERLAWLGKNPDVISAGYHECDLPACPTPENAPHSWKGIRLGNAEIWVEAADGTTYLAPNLIIHYIADHRYQPPKMFIDAAMAAEPSDDWIESLSKLPHPPPPEEPRRRRLP